MKKTLFLLSALLISFSSFGQDNIKQGLVVKYYDSGAVKSKTNYVNGELHGEYIGYYESGEVKIKGNYVNGKPHGEAILYDESGAVKAKKTM